MMQDSIFTQIIKGQLPCYKVYEDSHTMAFLDIHPVQPGHTLVIPKKQVEFVWDLPTDYYAALMKTVQQVALRLRSVLQVPYVGSKIIGIDVPHAHVQLIPFNTSEEFFTKQDTSSSPDDQTLSSIAQKLLFTSESQ